MIRAANRGYLSGFLLVCLAAQMMAPAAASMPCAWMGPDAGHAATGMNVETSPSQAAGHSAHGMIASIEQASAPLPASADCCDGSALCLLACIAPVGICTSETLPLLGREFPGRPDASVQRPLSPSQLLYRPPITA